MIPKHIYRSIHPQKIRVIRSMAERKKDVFLFVVMEVSVIQNPLFPISNGFIVKAVGFIDFGTVS